MKLNNQVFFGQVLAIFLEGYIEFLISARLFFDAPEDSVDNTPLLRSISWGMLSICLVVVPGLYIWIMKFDPDYLKKSK